MDTYFKQVQVAFEDTETKADVDVEVDPKNGTVLLGLWPRGIPDPGLFVSMTPDEARNVVEAIHFAITSVEFGAAYTAEDAE